MRNRIRGEGGERSRGRRRQTRRRHRWRICPQGCAHPSAGPPMAGNRPQRFTKFPLTTCSPPLLLFTFHDVSTATKCSVEPIPLARGLPGTAILHDSRTKKKEEEDDEFSRMILSFLRRVVELSNFIGGWLVRLSKERHWNSFYLDFDLSKWRRIKSIC